MGSIGNLLALAVAVSLVSCGPRDSGEGEASGSSSAGSVSCGKAVSAVTPLAPDLFVPGSYSGRAFLSPENHLGEDMEAPEGTEVRSPAAGTVVFYGPASGYGELLAVVEHELAAPVTVRDGDGGFRTVSTFLSIAGHLRPSQARGGAGLALKAGDCVTAGQAVGYVNDDANNGDGAEHLHSGVRLMGEEEARARDPSAPFRGYDTPGGDWRGDFASMHDLLAEISAAPTWHPDGTLVQVAGRPEIYRIEYGKRRHIPSEEDFLLARHYAAGSASVWDRVVTITETELSCYEAGLYDIAYDETRLVSCATGNYLVPGNDILKRRLPDGLKAEELRELLKSWGVVPSESVDGGLFCDLWESPWPLYLRDGTLVKEQGSSAVYAVANAVAWPIDTWDTFLAFGYRQSAIQVVPAGSLKRLVLAVSGELLTSAHLHRCMASIGAYCTDAVCMASIGGGGVEPEPPSGGSGGSGSGGSGGSPACVPEPETCNNKDDDCDSYADEDFDFLWDTANCGSCGLSCARPNAQFGCVQGVCEWWSCQPGYADANHDWSDGCESAACAPGEEICNGQDDDCDGYADEDGVCSAGADAGAEPAPEPQPEAGPSPGSGHTVRVRYPATSCLNTDIPGGWPKVCESGPFDHTWQIVSAGLKRMNYQVGGQWLCGETAPGQVVTPYGLPEVWVDGTPVQALAIHDWRMTWGCNIMLCVGGPCELCCDGKDNDGDGLVDLADQECADAFACL